MSRSEALYLAEDPSPPACDPYDPRPPRVHLNGAFDISRACACRLKRYVRTKPRRCHTLPPDSLFRDSSLQTRLPGRKAGSSDAFHALPPQRNVVFLTCCVWKNVTFPVLVSSALQFLLDSHDQPAQHPVPLRRTPPGPATPCSPGANAEHVHVHAAGPSLPDLTLHVRVVSRGQGGITEGLVKGALSVAASAYKALFTGPNCSVQVGSSALPHTGCCSKGGLLLWGGGVLGPSS